MRFLSPRDHGYRIGNSASRTTIPKVDDTKVIQEKTLNAYSDESHDQIEYFSNYGFTSVVQPPTGQGANAQTAEAMVVYMGSNRSHGVVVANGDRRFRLFKLANGEVALHDDQGHQIHVARDGVHVSAPNSKKVVIQIMDDDTLPQDDSSTVNGQKLGQIQQKGRPAAINMSIDKNGFTLNHPKGAVTINSQSFTVNASADIKLIGGGNALFKGVTAILYATQNAFVKAIGNINVKSAINKATPDFVSGASDPPISS